MNLQTGVVASAIWVQRAPGAESIVFIDIDGEQIAELLPDIRTAVEDEKAHVQMQLRELEEESLQRFAAELEDFHSRLPRLGIWCCRTSKLRACRRSRTGAARSS